MFVAAVGFVILQEGYEVWKLPVPVTISVSHKLYIWVEIPRTRQWTYYVVAKTSTARIFQTTFTGQVFHKTSRSGNLIFVEYFFHCS